MKIKKLAGRCLALLLAGTFLFSEASPLLGTVAHAAAGDQLMLSFVNSADPKVGYMIRGEKIDMRGDNVLGYSPKGGELALSFYVEDEKKNSLFSLPTPTKSGSSELYRVESLINDETKALDDKRVPYSIQTNYDSLTTTGTVAGSIYGGTLTITNPLEIPISQDSTITLTYKKGQGLGYTIGASNAGYFSRWLAEGETGKADRVTLDISNGGADCNKRYESNPTYHISMENHSFQFTPGTSYVKYETEDGKRYDREEDVPKGVAYTPKQYYGIDPDKDSTYTITFHPKGSNEVILNVLGRVEARREVLRKAVALENGLPAVDLDTGSRLIQLKDKDTLEVITGDFLLTSRYSYLNTSFKLDWEWIPDDKQHQNVVTIKQNAFGTSGEREVVVVPREEDVKGKLKVKVNYSTPHKDSDSDKDEGLVVDDLGITIRGTGKSGFVQQIKYTIGESGTEQVIDVEKNGMPDKTFTMDIYQGGVPGYSIEPEGPDTLEYTIYSGEGNGLVQAIRVDSSVPEALEAYIKKVDGSVEPYDFGTGTGEIYPIENPSVGHPITFVVKAKTPDTTTKLDFYFYVAVSQTNQEPMLDPYAKQPQSMFIRVTDNSPDDTAQLAELLMRNAKNNRQDIEGFVFKPDVYEDPSYSVAIDYEIGSVVLKPKVYETAQRDIGIQVETYNAQGQWVEADESIWDKSKLDTNWYEDFQDYLDQNADKAQPSYRSHTILNSGITLNLNPGERVRVTMKVRAQNPSITGKYVFILTRNLPSDDSTLKTLTFVHTEEDGTEIEYSVPLEVGKLDYTVRLPYRVKELQVNYEKNHPGAILTEDSFEPKLDRKGIFGSKNWLKLDYSLGPDGIEQMLFKIHVDAQNQVAEDASDYAITFLRDEPSHISTATNLEVTDTEGNALTLDPAFAGVLEDEDGAYTVRIPYIMDKVRVRLTMEDPYSTARMEYWVKNTQTDQTLVTGGLSKAIDVPVMSEDAPYYEVAVIVTAEDGKTSTTYKLRIERAEPDRDAYLAGLELKNLAGEIQEFEDPFDPEVTTYEALVLYATDKVTVTPTTSSPTATVRVKGRKVESGQPSTNISVKYPGYEEIEVEVTAQDGETVKVYKIRVKRLEPSSDSRLRALEVSDVDRLKPVFSPKTLHYTANVNEGVTEVTVTATVNDPFATLQIDGKDAVSGQPSEPIPLLDVYQTVTVVVTAQDGKSSTTYEVELYNTNMVEKSSNADLANLKVIEGQMEPGFAPSVLTYEVYVKEDLNSVEIIPTPADPMAKVQVFFGTLEIGDEEGNYEYAIADGENTFSVRVTAPDGSKYKDYTVIVYRNEEGKMGFLQPITAEDIDFENSGDIILVDITKYPRVAADVFNTLKTEYPEKTIIFEGNDYSLQFDGADIEKIIPHTEVFDFSLSFDSPYRSEIMKKIRRYSANDDARIVLVHFGDSKELPAPARFTLSLGRKYRDDQLYWHYWNQERERIDYYGTVDTNSKGTFAVKLERLGDYIVADQRLAGSEDKSTSIAEDGDLTKDTSLLKTNPNTGERGDGQ